MTLEGVRMAEDRKPKWAKWKLIPEVELWQAVSLSMDIEPSKTKTDSYAWMGAEHPFDEGEDFNDRLEVLKANFTNRAYFPTAGKLSMENWWKCGLSLPEFALWCDHVGIVIPDGLAGLASKQRQDIPDNRAYSESALEDIDLLSVFSESVNNGVAINWIYWVNQMPTLSAAQAARLMCALDPDVFDNLKNRPNQNDPSNLVQKAKMIQRLAEAQEMREAAPIAWLEWAKERHIAVHHGFEIEVRKSIDSMCVARPQVKPIDMAKKRQEILETYSLRGAKRRILEYWDTVEKLHPKGADGTMVLRILERSTDAPKVKLKTVQNHLISLRKDGLIP
jgi:hypothetical protein